MASSLRNWIRNISPIQVSIIEEIRIQGVLDNFGSTKSTFLLDFPILEKQSVSENFILYEDIEITSDFSFYEYSLKTGIDFSDSINLSIPNSSHILLGQLDANVHIIDYFEKLGKERIAGRLYSKDEVSKIAQIPFPIETAFIDRSKCPHGLRRFECGRCAEEQEQRKTRRAAEMQKIRTLDVFELLRPILMPPFEHMLDNQDLFPAATRPYRFQIDGINFLRMNRNALLGDDMGLGKTIQSIVAIRLLMNKGKIVNSLIICPLSLLGNWEKEFSKWAPELSVLKIRGSKDLREKQWKSQNLVYLTTYETLREDIENHFVDGSHFNLVVLDEIQRIKNTDSQISKAMRSLAPKYRWGLSGTPLENKVEDVVSIFKFIKPDLRFPDESDPISVRKTIKPFFMRRRLRDIEKELPEKFVQEYWLDLNRDQQIAYDQAFLDAKAEIQGDQNIDRIHFYALITKLKLICNGDEETGDSCKKDLLVDQLDEIIPQGYKAIVFSQYPVKTLKKLKETLVDHDPELFSGETSQQKREEIIQQFQTEKSPKVLLASLKAGGIGLNLQRANHIFHFDHWWNPAIAKQAEGRAYRIGQTRTVFVHDIYTNGTIEERIYEILKSKQGLFDLVIDDLSAIVTEASITDEELYSLFDLKPPKLTGPSKISNIPGANKDISFDEIRSYIKSLNPSEFESLIGKIFSAKSYSVQVIGGANDGGVDIRARGITGAGFENITIQCKHYFDRQVGPEIIRAALGAKQIQKVDRMFIVTSGIFSNEAKKVAGNNNIYLMDLTDILGEIKAHNNLIPH